MISNTRLDELAAMEAAATAGPWEAGHWTSDPNQYVQVFCSSIEVCCCPAVVFEEDAAFIAAARNEFAIMIEQCRESNRDRQDAIRYRWLYNNKDVRFEIMAEITPIGEDFWTAKDDLDRAIDAALKGPTP